VTAPLPSYINEHQAIVGNSGSGKTVTGKAEAEQLLRERRHVAIIDLTDVWYGLRSDVAGTGPGFDIPIFGGRHGDVPIGPGDGDAIARLIIEQRVSAIVSLGHLHDDVDQRLFLAPFVKRLRAKPRGNFHLIVDEAEEVAPQTAPDDLAFGLTRDLIWIAKRGRVAGFVLTVITQRPADISKAVLSQAQTIIAHQLIDPRDQKAIDDYLKAKGDKAVRADVMRSLPGLERGERWIYSPRLGILERGFTAPIATFDSSRTPAPGEVHVEPKMLAELDVSAIAAALKTSPADAPIGANVDGAAAARVVELEGLLAEERGGRARTEAHVTELEDGLRRIRCTIDMLLADPGSGETEHAGGEREAGHSPQATPHHAGGGEAAAEGKPSGAASARPASPISGSVDLPPRRQRILDAVAWCNAFLKRENAPRAIVAYFADTTPSSSTFERDLGAMRTLGLVEYPAQGEVALTATGRALAQPHQAPATRAALLEAIAAKLPPRRARILRALWNGRKLTRDDLAGKCDTSASSSTFERDLGAMRTLGLVDYPAKGEVVLADLFREGPQ
jgi:hypothetical protein